MTLGPRTCDLSQKEAANKADFFGTIANKDGSTLPDLLRAFRMYTLETLLYLPYTAYEKFAFELKYDAYLSGLKGFDASALILKARSDILGRRDGLVFLSPYRQQSWPSKDSQRNFLLLSGDICKEWT